MPPTLKPTKPPLTFGQTHQPTSDPTLNPSISPSNHPTLILQPTMSPSLNPSISSSHEPTIQLSNGSTLEPTLSPTLNPTTTPTEPTYVTVPNMPTTAVSKDVDMQVSDPPTSAPNVIALASDDKNTSTMSYVLVVLVSVGTTIVVMLCLFTCCLMVCRHRTRKQEERWGSASPSNPKHSGHYPQSYTQPSVIKTNITGPSITDLEDNNNDLPPMPADTPIQNDINIPIVHANHGQIVYVPKVNHVEQRNSTELVNIQRQKQYPNRGYEVPAMPYVFSMEPPSLPPSTIHGNTKSLHKNIKDLMPAQQTKMQNVQSFSTSSVTTNPNADDADGYIMTEENEPREGDRTVPERDIIDRLYGNPSGHISLATDSPIETDIESLYAGNDGKNSVFGNTLRPSVKVTLSVPDADKDDIVHGVLVEADEEGTDGDSDSEDCSVSSSYTAHKRRAMYKSPSAKNQSYQKHQLRTPKDFVPYFENVSNSTHEKQTVISISEMIISNNKIGTNKTKLNTHLSKIELKSP